MITTIVADGQAGAAQGALRAAVDLDLGHGGWTAAEDLPAIYAERARRTSSPRMAARLNVQDSDGTLLFAFGQELRAGTYAAYTDEAAEHQRKAFLQLVLPAGGRSSVPESVRSQVLEWIREGRIAVLHVAGPRESEEPGIQEAVRDALVWIFEDELPARLRPAMADIDRAAPVESLARKLGEVDAIVASVDYGAPRPVGLPDAKLFALAELAGLDVEIAPMDPPTDPRYSREHSDAEALAFDSPSAPCSDCGAEIIGYHGACEGVPGGFGDDASGG